MTTTTPTPCPCPRPEGLSDEEVREVLAHIRAGLVTADEVRAARGLPPTPSQAAEALRVRAVEAWPCCSACAANPNDTCGCPCHPEPRHLRPVPSQAAGRAIELRVTLTDRPLIEARIEGRRAPDDVQAAVSFIGWARGWARWTPPPPKPSTLFDAARGWLARRRAAWLASEERRVAAIRDAERTSRLRRAGREAAEVNRALAEGRLGLVAGGLPVGD